MVTLRRPAPASPAEVIRDAAGLGPSAAAADLTGEQRAVIADEASRVQVVAGPGTGKTRLAVHVVVDRVRRVGLDPDRCLLLAPTRLAAARLRDQVTDDLGVIRGGSTTQPLARTVASFAMSVLRADAALRGAAPPRLLSGPEQDIVLGELLAGHAAGAGIDPGWPVWLRPALTTRGFRAELRDLFMRTAELGLDPIDLAGLGRANDRPEWVAAAALMSEYDEVTALSRPGAYDPGWLLSVLADLIDERSDLRDRVLDGLDLIVVDDAQDMTPAAVRLLQVLARGHAQQVLLGDPDSAVQTFRGTDPSGWLALPGSTHRLTRTFRLPRLIAQMTQQVSSHIGVVGDGGHRRLEATADGGAVETHLLRSGAQEGAYIASRIRQGHLIDGLAWSQMAVIVRGSGRTAGLRRALAAAGVPVAAGSGDLPLRDEPAVRPLLTLLEFCLDETKPSGGDPAGDGPSLPAAEVIVDLLTSPFGGADPVGLRSLRRALRRIELADGGGRSSDDLLIEAVVTPVVLGEVGPEGAPARRIAHMLAAGRSAAGEPEATAESVLWALWSGAGVARTWRAEALAGGPRGVRRDRDVDAVLALFDAAARFVDRLPAAPPGRFLDHVRQQEVAGDSLAARAPDGESVALLTPAAAAGREWLRVFVAGVQDGVWPDPRVRGTLLGSAALVDAVTGRSGSWRAAAAAVRHDETRLFHVAVTRAREEVVVTAVRSDDDQPSSFLDMLTRELPGHVPIVERSFTDVDRPLTLTALVAHLRREVVGGDPAARGAAITALARLARAQVPGADPSTWWAMREVTDTRPLRPADESVRISPSKLDQFARCPLQWLLRTRGGEGPAVGSADIGTLVHHVAATIPDQEATAEALRHRIDELWPRLGLGPGWVATQRREETYAMVDRFAQYVSSLPAQGWRRVAAEESLRVSLGRGLLTGQVDRIEAGPDGRLRIIDLKTGSRKPTKTELATHPQLAAYQVATEHGAFAAYGTANAGAGLLQLGRAATKQVAVDIQEPLADGTDPAWAEQMIHDAVEGMSGAAFVAMPDKHCDTCPVAGSCPADRNGKGARL
ncbi:MAG: ATP-dependent helicase [Nostocoides sp.]